MVRLAGQNTCHYFMIFTVIIRKRLGLTLSRCLFSLAAFFTAINLPNPGVAQTSPPGSRANYNSATNVLSLPSIEVDGQYYSGQFIYIDQSNPARFDLVSTSLTTNPPVSNFANNTLLIPELLVGESQYAVELVLISETPTLQLQLNYAVEKGSNTGIQVGDKIWRPLKETLGFSFLDMATVCNQTTGVCDGSLNGVDFSGWTWASQDEVLGMFNEFIPGVFEDLDDANPAIYELIDVEAVGNFFEVFEPTSSSRYAPAIALGISRTRNLYDGVEVLQVTKGNHESGHRDLIGNGGFVPLNFSSSTLSVWLFRPASW